MNPSKRLHIAHFTNTYLPVMSGVVRSISSFRQAQIDLGHNVFIFAQEARKYEDPEPFIFRYPSLNIPLRNYPATIPVSPYIDWVLPSLKLDVIHAHHPALVGQAASDKAEELGVPLVFTHHTRYQEYASYMGIPDTLVIEVVERLIADYLQQCHHVIAPSSSIKRMIEETYGITSRVTVVPTGIDLQPYKEADGRAVRQKEGWQEDQTIMVTVGRLAEEKNLHTLIDAADYAMQRHDNLHLVLIGEGPALKSLEKQAEKLRIDNRVHFLGRVPYEEMPGYLKAADLFCFASVSETQGLVTMEAMAAGLPVAAVDATGTSDIVIDGKNGLLAPNDAEALGKAIDRLLTDKNLKNQFQEAIEETMKTFEIHNTTKKMLEVYQQAKEDKKGGRQIKADERKPIFTIAWKKLLDRLELAK